MAAFDFASRVEIADRDAPRPLHVLIIPSEEYVPAREPLAGIFQKNQIDAMRGDYRTGVLSVRLEHSVPMYAKAFLRKCAGLAISSKLQERSFGGLVRDFCARLDRRANLSPELDGDVQVMRARGLYLLPPSPRSDHVSWVAAGEAAYRAYVAEAGTPDLVHAHNISNAGLLAARLRARYGVPFVLTEHSSYFHQRLVPRGLKRAIRAAIADAACFTVVGDAVRASLEDFLGALPKRPDILPNALPSRFEDDVSFEKHSGSPPMLLCIGNLLPVKGHEILLRAFAKFRLQVPDCRLRLIGEGPLRAPLEDLSRQLGIESAVEFAGLKPAEEVRAAMGKADALVLPSLYETFGVVLIEAMACGLPAIATACGGPREIVTPDCGILVEPGNPESLLAGLREFHTRKDAFDAAAIRARALKRFGKDAYRMRLRQIYDLALQA